MSRSGVDPAVGAAPSRRASIATDDQPTCCRPRRTRRPPSPVPAVRWSAPPLVAVTVLFVGALLVRTRWPCQSPRNASGRALRSAGATRGQMHRMVLAEALSLAPPGPRSASGWSRVRCRAGAAWRPSRNSPRRRHRLDLAALAMSLLLGLLVTLAAALDNLGGLGRVSPSKRSSKGGRCATGSWGIRRTNGSRSGDDG